MTDLANMREQYEAWPLYVRSLVSVPESEQLKPIAEGKWAVRDVVGHMWKWDIFFWEHAVGPLVQGSPITLTYHEMDFHTFNEAAKIECRKLEWSYVLEETAKMREKIVEAIRTVPETKYEHVYPDADGNSFSIKAFLEDFVHHDLHHRRQIEGVLNVPNEN